jgi:hypothetical protein
MNNNKLIKIMLLITAITFIMLGCDKKPASKSIETDEILIDFSYLDESFLRKYDIYDSFIENEDYGRIAFTSNVPVKDFSWLSIFPDFDDRDEIIFGIDRELYSLEELHPQKPFVVTWIEVGIFPNRGFSYRDKNGQKQYYALYSGNYGGDPEEYDGPALVAGQIFPMKIVTGRYENTYDETSFILDLTENDNTFTGTSYTLKVNDIVYTGTAHIDFENGNDSVEWHIFLGEIKWAHNWIENFSHGVPDSEPDKWADEETYGINLWLEEGNELVFQNRGNPMAPYIIFDEVTEKFVRLIRW